MKSVRFTMLRGALLAAASTASVTAGSAAYAQAGGDKELVLTEDLHIIANHLVIPGVATGQTGSAIANSPAVLAPRDELNGVGQQIAFLQVNNTQASLGTCTGSLINARTVLTAAHCVYSAPAHVYGSATGTSGGTYGAVAAAYGATQGTPISFGFSALNRGCSDPATHVVVPCPVGQKGPYEAWRDGGFKTVTSQNIYNGNQVWYHPDSTAAFALADIALVTLDTHAKGVPTWTMLFSPLTAPTHTTITGYGGRGSGATGGIPSPNNIDYRRRSAENMIDALMSRNTYGIGATPGIAAAPLFHQMYWMDFDDPTRPLSAADLPTCYFKFVNCTDFGGLGGHGPEGRALPNEASTAGGDSGGPLIVDRLFTNADGSFRQVIAGVLTGSISYTGGAGYYGQLNVYPPLYQYWQSIVAQNPYVYASAKEGNGSWFDAGHWVQDMDPNYGIIGPDGNLLMGLPDFAQGNGTGATAEFGNVCAVTLTASTANARDAFGVCTDIARGQNQSGDGNMVFTAGGPGSTNFVPNNIEPVNSADPTKHVWARYYDVTLSRPGTTILDRAATVDVMTLDHGRAKLDIATGGSLKTWADYTQWAGWTNVDGTLNTNEMLVTTGLLSGSGVVNADYLTVVGGIVAPGGADKVGTLTVNGDVILASASSFFVDASRRGADKLAVNGLLDLNGGSVVFSKPADAPAPRHGDTFTIATATGGVSGTFGQTYSFQGVLRPELTYGANDITALLRAGSLVTILDGQNATALAFAGALDQLRSASYNNLYSLYGSVDLMGADELSMTLSGLAPRITGETRKLQDKQSKVMLGAVTDRLSSLGTRSMQRGLSIVGSPVAMGLNQNDQAVEQSFAGLVPTAATARILPKGVSGFVSGGVNSGTASYGDSRAALQGQRSSHVGMGLETELFEGLTLGTAFGYSAGFSAPGGDRSESKMSQVAVYGAYRLGGGVYVAGVASAESSKADVQRRANTGEVAFDLYGATNSARYNLMAEAGVNLAVAEGLTLTPRAQLGYDSYRLGGFRENGGEAALRMDTLQLDRVEARMGAKLAGAQGLGKGWTVIPQIQADYVHMVAGSNAGMKVSFANAGDYMFTLPFAGGDTSWAEARGGVKLVRDRLEIGAGIETAFGRSEVRDDRAVADFTFRF